MLGRGHRRTVFLAVLVAVCTGLIALVLRSAVANASPDPSPAARPVSTTVAVSAASLVHAPAMGTVHGIVRLRAPAASRQPTWAVFVLDGPTRLIRDETKDPFELLLDTRQLANGRYTLTAITHFRDREQAIVIATLSVDNINQQPPPGARATTAVPSTAAPQPGIAPAAPPRPQATAPASAPAASTNGPPPATAPDEPGLPTVTATRPLKF